MVMQLIGAAALARLIDDGRAGPDLSWLLYGPEDEAVVEAADPEPPRRPWLMAAE